MSQKNESLNVAVFFCRRLDANQDANRRNLEKERGSRIRFFPLPCSGRIDPVQLLRALETGADMVYLVTCPENTCRYREGNMRAKKRLFYAKGLIKEIGLEPERLEFVMIEPGRITTIDKVTRELLARDAVVGPSRVRAAKSAKEKVNIQKGASL